MGYCMTLRKDDFTQYLDIRVWKNHQRIIYEECRFVYAEIDDDEAERDFVADFLSKYKFYEFLRSKMLRAFEVLRYGDDWIDSESIYFSLKDRSEPYTSCAIKNYEDSTSNKSKENEVSLFNLKQNLATADKECQVLKYFEDKKCSICLSNYTEILGEDLHIVIPSCGHPLCCKCADNILNSKKKECPQCRERITAQSFNLMKFNADLEIDTENQKLYL